MRICVWQSTKLDDVSGLDDRREEERAAVGSEEKSRSVACMMG